MNGNGNGGGATLSGLHPSAAGNGGGANGSSMLGVRIPLPPNAEVDSRRGIVLDAPLTRGRKDPLALPSYRAPYDVRRPAHL